MTQLRPFLTLIVSMLIFLPVSSLAQEIKVGISMSLSGASAEAGEDCMRGIDLARDLESLSKLEADNKIRYIVEDNRSEPRVAVDGFRKLIDINKANVVLTARSPIGMALNPISKAKKIPILGVVGHQDFATQNEYAYQFWPTTENEGGALANEIIKDGHKTIAVLYTEDEWTKNFSEGIKKIYKSNPENIVFYESVLPGESDFLTILTRIRKLKPDSIVFNHTLGELGTVLKKAKELGLKGMIYSNYWAGFKSVIDTVGKDKMEGVKFIEIDLQHEKFQSRFGEKYKAKFTPSAAAFTCYLSTLTIGQALNECKANEFAECMEAIKEINTPDGPIKIVDRRVQFPLALKEVRNGEVVVLEE